MMFAKRKDMIMMLVCLFVICSVLPAFAQWNWDNRYMMQGDGVVMGGVGYSRIQGQNYLLVNMRTDLAFGDFGLGVDIPLRINTENILATIKILLSPGFPALTAMTALNTETYASLWTLRNDSADTLE